MLPANARRADLTVDALRLSAYSAREPNTTRRQNLGAVALALPRCLGQPGGERRPFAAISCSSSRSVGARMKTSHIMSSWPETVSSVRCV